MTRLLHLQRRILSPAQVGGDPAARGKAAACDFAVKRRDHAGDFGQALAPVQSRPVNLRD
jgi:hypothetical protein